MSAIIRAITSEKIVLVYQDYKGQGKGYALSTEPGHYESDLRKIFSQIKKLCKLLFDCIRSRGITLAVSWQSHYYQNSAEIKLKTSSLV